ncbi:hypothetical protein BUALT_Bualt18G0080500 [Buddleja alternifolia]|uniref:Uncharacterized protein n=1 Tax=Buddleja alternifolia TaxID=168488 RepID=A0AAV6W551_9LAMI|nr:hypothetical protein BUALT_Bualt18G0080500 [Buddleja alternifolia]
MYARHRNGPGNGYRSNPMGMGGGLAASRISPEGSMRAHRVYSSEYRNNNRGGYGRGGHSKQFQPPHPPRRPDIFVEAGKLAAEYLVSKGVIPPNALSGKWRGDSFKKQIDEFQGFRRPDEYNSRERRRSGSIKNYESETNKELGRSGSRGERNKASPGMEVDSDTSGGYNNEQSVEKCGNGGIQTLSPGEITNEDENAAHLESGLEKCNSVEDVGAKASSSSIEKNLRSDGDGETIKRSDDANKVHAKTVEGGGNNNDLEQKQEENKEVTASVKEDSLVSEEDVDLSKHRKFENVPTKAPSLLIVKSSNNEHDPMNEDENKSQVSEIHVIDVANDNSAVNVSSHQDVELKSLESDALHAPSTMLSFPERSLCKEQEQEPDQGLSAFGSSNSMFNNRGEKRAIDDETDDREGFKKLKEWVPPMDSQSDACLPLSSSIENQSTLQEQGTSRGSFATLSPDQKNLNISLFSKGHAEFMQEKQLFPGSFKSFDLNLNGTCDVNENHDADPVLIFPSVTQTRKEMTPIDIDLSMTKNCSLPNKNVKHGFDDNDIEIIDLENDSAQEDKTIGNLERREDAVFTDLGGFHDNVHNANEIPEVQDGYGLMISELLGNDNPNCSSVPTDLNSLHNDIGLPNGEGILGDDDSIYMSLGEIPISTLKSCLCIPLVDEWNRLFEDLGAANTGLWQTILTNLVSGCCSINSS